MSRSRPRHVAVAQPSWADVVLDVRPTPCPLPSTAPEAALGTVTWGLVHAPGPKDGWALLMWRTGAGKDKADVLRIEAPDGTRTAVVTEAPKWSMPGRGLCEVAFSLMVTESPPPQFFTPIGDDVWAMLPPLHTALRHLDQWLAPDADPVQAWADARTLLAWAPYGYTQADAENAPPGVESGRAWNQWRAHFTDPAQLETWARTRYLGPVAAAWWHQRGITDPATAYAWTRTRLPSDLAMTLHGLDWNAVEDGAALQARLGYLPDVNQARLEALARLGHQHDLTSADVITLYQANLPFDEVADALAAGAWDMDAVRTLIALQTP